MPTSNSISETKDLAGRFLSSLRRGFEATIVGLRGNLGSGKTTFTKAVAEHLGLKETITSPTFVIEKIYKLDNQKFDYLIHIDAYRLESGKELLVLGWEEISKDPNNLILIEWPENVEDVLPDDVRYIDFGFVDERTREISY
jgi:tRNA threonylcarbamoyladenosine biosynthesis protein TsaE